MNFSQHCRFLAMEITAEAENGTRESMTLAGLRRGSFLGGWATSFFAVSSLSSFASALVARSHRLFGECEFGLIVVNFQLFSMSAVATGIFFSCISGEKTKVAAQISGMFWFVGGMLYYPSSHYGFGVLANTVLVAGLPSYAISFCLLLLDDLHWSELRTSHVILWVSLILNSVVLVATGLYLEDIGLQTASLAFASPCESS
jgi:hypothetical protein